MNNTILNLERYYSPMLKVLKFQTSDEGALLVFGVPNAKYLAFSTLYASALTVLSSSPKNVENTRILNPLGYGSLSIHSGYGFQ